MSSGILQAFLELTSICCNQVVTTEHSNKSTGDYLSDRSGQKVISSVKKRDPAGTRDALLTAGRTEFQRVGYEAASTRTIASDAKCNAALINRYFGSKIGLFEAVMEECIDLAPLKGLSTSDMVEALVEIALGKTGSTGGFDPMVVAIKSSGSEEARNVIREKLGNPMVEQLAALIGGNNANHKAGVLLSIVSGMFVGRVSVGADALSATNDHTLRKLLSDAMLAVLSPEN